MTLPADAVCVLEVVAVRSQGASRGDLEDLLPKVDVPRRLVFLQANGFLMWNPGGIYSLTAMGREAIPQKELFV